MVPGDVEFLGPTPPAAGAPDEDELDTASRRPSPWVLVTIGLAALALVVAGIAVAHHPAGHRAAAGSAASAAPSARASFAPVAGQPVPLGGTPLRLGNAPVAALTLAGSSLVALGGRRLSVLDPRTGRMLRSVGVPTSDAATYQLLPTDTGRMWLVAVRPASTRLREYDLATLRLTRQVTVRQAVSQVASYQGLLLLATNRGLGVVGDGPGGADMVWTGNRLWAVAADPTTHLAAADNWTGTGLVIHPGGRLARVPPSGALEMVKGSLAIVAGHVWAIGYGMSGAVIEQMNPATLRPRHASPLAAQLGPGATLVGTGTSVLWIMPADVDGQLWCVDARTGAVLQTWSGVVGPVVSRHGLAVAVSGSAGEALRLHLRGCPG